ncbi:NAD(P)-dependent oxidoreductase [Ideonella dechloratans]|uniref:NAD(P)-dependent oxidoreductase n=1 Tax=Ideonella dechloratans TaxID=36863 RepID=UPI0035AFB05D
MTHVAFLGLGAMGSRMAARLLQAGHTLTVWNRHPAACAPLNALGAKVANTPRAAASQADVAIAMVRDDEASRSVWCDPDIGALSGLPAGALAMDCSTLTPRWTRELAAVAHARGIGFLESPVSGSRPAAEAGQLVFLLGGEPVAVQQAAPLVAAMGAASHHLGPVGHAALAKLATNALLGLHVAGLAEVIALLEREGADPAPLLQAMATTPVWAPVDHPLSAGMLRRDFQPQFPVTLIAKDFGYALHTAGGANHAPVLAATLAQFQRAIEQGLGELNMTALIRALPAPSP